MKLKETNFYSLHLIDRLTILHQMVDDINTQYRDQHQMFKKFINELDDCYANDVMSIDEKIFELNYIMAKQDYLIEQLKAIRDIVSETKAQLSN